jgi:hypothetical protein
MFCRFDLQARPQPTLYLASRPRLAVIPRVVLPSSTPCADVSTWIHPPLANGDARNAGVGGGRQARARAQVGARSRVHYAGTSIERDRDEAYTRRMALARTCATVVLVLAASHANSTGAAETDVAREREVSTMQGGVADTTSARDGERGQIHFCRVSTWVAGRA